MTDEVYKIGTKRSIGRSWATPDGTPIDPDFLAITVREPNGAKSKFLKEDLVNVQPGTWVVDWTFRLPGRHVFTIETWGNVVRADEYFVQVSRPQGYAYGESVAATGKVITEGWPPDVIPS